MVILYNAHHMTGEYLQGRNSAARQNPMWRPETHNTDECWLYNPQTSSLQPPPETGDHEVAVLENGLWVVKPDHRKEVYFDTATQTRHEINDIGIELDPAWTEKEPLSNSKWNGTDWAVDFALWLESVVRPQRDSKLTACDYRMMPDFPMDAEKKTEWEFYRQALRDLPSQLAEVVNPIPWPLAPAQ
ncbi:tail fiber assembly protein [Desulfoluna spongiiphila]|uniref:Phage tail assembly chaperone protein n=1 Tax=Desulfoluna spongiiphila TaxID=419481 RepID=A0A1G5G2S1_9BACT|nr:tail fiber assembly protein [Desulfoluna spongiiphila]SCY45863.1 Phage tail assembly chaperone protein [Desulfoluna spongiiphila]